MAYGSPMIAKVPEDLKNRYKNLNADSNSQFGSLRSIFDQVLSSFLEEKPWNTDEYFVWKIPVKNESRSKKKWVLFNVVAQKSISNKAKNQAWKLEISLQTFLYTALNWWYFKHAPLPKEDNDEFFEERRRAKMADDLFVDEAKEIIKKKKSTKREEAT